MTTTFSSTSPSTTVPAIDYTDKDFGSLRQAMLDLAAYRLPEWTDRSAADVGMLLVDMFAYVGDILSYYQDRIASESFLDTAVERRSVMHLLRLIGYELSPPVPASAEIDIVFNMPVAPASTMVRIPTGAAFTVKPVPGAQGPPPTFTYLGADLDVDLAGPAVTPRADGKVTVARLPVRHCVLVRDEALGASTGEPNLSFPLTASTVLVDTVAVTVDEGAGPVGWERQDNLLFHRDDVGHVETSTSTSRDYMVQFDESGAASVRFGDGVYGMRPPVGNANIRATYAAGAGAAGNVAAGTITQALSQIPNLFSVSNPLPAVGGADAETLEHARRFGPLAYRSGDRAVTLRDYSALALRAGGVAKVGARTTGWNRVELFVAPEGPVLAPATPELRQHLVAYLEDRRMVGTSVRIEDPIPVAIDIAVDVFVDHHHDASVVRTTAEAAVGNLVAFANVDFGRPLYLSKIYEAVEAIDGVAAATVQRFRRQDQAPPKAFLRRRGLLVEAGLGAVGDFVERAYSGQIAVEGRLEIGEFELPVPGVITVDVRYEQ